MLARVTAVALCLVSAAAGADDKDLGRIEEVDGAKREIDLERGRVLKVDKRAEVFRNGDGRVLAGVIDKDDLVDDVVRNLRVGLAQCLCRVLRGRCASGWT